MTAIQLIKKSFLMIFFFTTLLVFCKDSSEITEPPTSSDSNIIKKYGQLSINGTTLVDKDKNIVVLRGMSLFWSQWGGSYYQEEIIKWLRDDWKCTVIRAAMGVESGGYLENAGTEYQKVTTVIDACIKLGLYVIVDWHDHHGENHLQEAKKFFKNISTAYGDQPNIIYEIYNEPLDVSWTDVIKPFAEEVMSAIRANDPDNIIIVGTPNWSQDVEQVIGHRIDDANVVYSLHFYAGTHRQWLRDKSSQAILAELPLFVSEWGLSEANGSGDIDYVESKRWTDYLDGTNLSWCNWSIINKDETSAALLPSNFKLSNWTTDELTESGNLVRDYIIRMNTDLLK